MITTEGSEPSNGATTDVQDSYKLTQGPKGNHEETTRKSATTKYLKKSKASLHHQHVFLTC